MWHLGRLSDAPPEHRPAETSGLLFEGEVRDVRVERFLVSPWSELDPPEQAGSECLFIVLKGFGEARVGADTREIWIGHYGHIPAGETYRFATRSEPLDLLLVRCDRLPPSAPRE